MERPLISKHKTDKGTPADALIIGAGASGLICARTAARRGLSVIVLDHSTRPARKVLASGGGHCNYTNLEADPSRYQSANPHFTRSALARYTPKDALEFLRKRGIRFEERDEGQIFLLKSASEIVEALVEDCQRAGVSIVLGAKIDRVSRAEDMFEARTDKGVFRARKLVIAMGGRSWGALGATATGYQLSIQFGHEITELRPGLVPLTLKGKKHPFAGLSGLSFRAAVTAAGHEFTGDVLVTHKGLSGPAILRASSYWRDGVSLKMNLLPGVDTEGWLMEHRESKMELKTLLMQKLPKRLALSMAEHLQKPSERTSPLSSYSDKHLRGFANILEGLEIFPSGTEGFSKAEVTVGGVDTRKVSSKSMESTITPGLYFTGEVLDVTGDLGGFNLHWAWASGRAAGESL